MTPAEKLALAQRSYAAFNAGLDIDALLPLYHPDCEWRMGPGAAAFGTEVFRGHDGLRAWVAALDEGFETWATQIDEARITSDGVLLLHNHATARSRGTQMELAIQTWQEIRDRDGLIVSVVQFDAPPPRWVEATPVG